MATQCCCNMKCDCCIVVPFVLHRSASTLCVYMEWRWSKVGRDLAVIYTLCKDNIYTLSDRRSEPSPGSPWINTVEYSSLLCFSPSNSSSTVGLKHGCVAELLQRTGASWKQWQNRWWIRYRLPLQSHCRREVGGSGDPLNGASQARGKSCSSEHGCCICTTTVSTVTSSSLSLLSSSSSSYSEESCSERDAADMVPKEWALVEAWERSRGVLSETTSFSSGPLSPSSESESESPCEGTTFCLHTGHVFLVLVSQGSTHLLWYAVGTKTSGWENEAKYWFSPDPWLHFLFKHQGNQIQLDIMCLPVHVALN